MYSFEYEFKSKMIFGPGKVKSRLAEIVKSLDEKAVVGIVTDKGIVNAGLLKDVTDALEAENIKYAIFDEVEPNPSVTTADQGAKKLVDFGVNVMLAVGGGSPMDVSKAICVIATNGGKAIDYLGRDKFTNMPLPMICIPTTAGTGSEVTYAAVLTVRNEKESAKISIASLRLTAKVVILDPNFLLTAPFHVAAFCGMDVVSHALEALFNVNESPIADVYAWEALKLVNKHLRPYAANRKDIEAAGGMLLASTLAGAAFSITITNLNHSMSHAMSAYFNVPHGAANALLMPHTMRYYMLADKGKFKKVAEALGENVAGLSDREAAPLAIKAVEKLLADLEVPTKMSAFGIKKEDIPTLVKGAMGNPIYMLVPRTPPTDKDIEKMFTAAL